MIKRFEIGALILLCAFPLHASSACITDKGCLDARIIRHSILKIETCFATGGCEIEADDYHYGAENLFFFLAEIESDEAYKILAEFTDYDFGDLPDDYLSRAIESVGKEMRSHLNSRLNSETTCRLVEGAKYNYCRSPDQRKEFIEDVLRNIETKD